MTMVVDRPNLESPGCTMQSAGNRRNMHLRRRLREMLARSGLGLEMHRWGPPAVRFGGGRPVPVTRTGITDPVSSEFQPQQTWI
jgi:hypothetical protein